MYCMMKLEMLQNPHVPPSPPPPPPPHPHRYPKIHRAKINIALFPEDRVAKKSLTWAATKKKVFAQMENEKRK